MIPGLFFANPWGLTALAAVPALVAIHFLQEGSRRARASTLFLLERAAPLPAGGMRLERFRNSLPFWMQLLAIIALAWLLVDPRWVRSESRQTVVVVLDSSASMDAARKPTLDLLTRRLTAWNAVASRTDWHLLETGPGRPPLYAGRSLNELLGATDGWRPTLGTHDPRASLALAEALVPGDAGVVMLVTDRPAPVPGGVAVLSAGEPFENVGFSGGDVDRAGERLVWRALVTNHGTEPQEREITAREVRSDGTPTTLGPPQSIRLESGQSRTVEGPWPEGAERVVVALSRDRFGIDDALPLVRPVPRIVKVAFTASGPAADLLARMVKVADGVEIVPDANAADLLICRFAPVPEADGIQLTIAAEPNTDDAGKLEKPSKRQPVAYDPAWVAAEDHPLTRDLGWGGLMSGSAGAHALTAADEPLLWKGRKPLAFVRLNVLPGGRRVQNLVLNFDLASSTAARSPAIVVLVQRFIDRIRARIERPWAANVETGQVLGVPPSVVSGPAGRAMMTVADINGGQPASLTPFHGRAPWAPGFFTVAAAQNPPATIPLVRGAAQFADSRESDFRGAAPVDTLEAIRLAQAIKQSIADPWAPLWAGIAIGALVIAWGWRGAKARAADDFPQHSGA